MVPSAEIRALREESPSNLATLCYKAVEKLVAAADASCRTQRDHLQVGPGLCSTCFGGDFVLVWLGIVSSSSASSALKTLLCY